jgi:NAD-dependent deacetylase
VLSLRDFERIVFFTGAGLSVESGIPTYRGKGGLWHEYDYEEYACQAAFDRDPDKVWDFHDVRRKLLGAAEPNDGHRVIAEVCAEKPATRIVTQNIDGLHQRAGARDVLELHGNIWRLRCASCGTRVESRESPLSSRQCGCGGWWRPEIVWFGDMLDGATLQAAGQAIAACDVLVSVGTSGAVYPAAELPRLAAARGAVCIEVNPEETAVSAWYTHHLRGPASEMLRRLWPA